MISISKKFVFIHPSKSGGTSVEASLSIFETHKKLGGDHEASYTLVKRLEQAGLNPAEFYFFGVRRNPWKRVLSAFLYRRDVLDPRTSDDTIPNNVTFKEFILDYVRGNSGADWDVNNQLNYFSATNDIRKCEIGIPVAQIFDIDDNRVWWPQLCNHLKIKVPLLQLNTTKKTRMWASYYENREMQQVVAKTHAWDISVFGYEFNR